MPDSGPEGNDLSESGPAEMKASNRASVGHIPQILGAITDAKIPPRPQGGGGGNMGERPPGKTPAAKPREPLRRGRKR